MQFRPLVSTAVAAIFVAGPLQAQSAPYEVVRMNDNAMTCEALIGEINTLSNEVRQQTADAARASRNRQTAGAVGRGLLSGLAQGVSMFGGGGNNGIGGAVAASALSGLANQAASTAASAPTEQPAAAAPSPQAERLAHLNDLNRSRGC
ncbi:MAG: hypothetical protein EON90_00070 [Brevundimonas sp.]|nr:MAG: hypothetical protein EON90_00070 [Brevundimonas sp.]